MRKMLLFFIPLAIILMVMTTGCIFWTMNSGDWSAKGKTDHNMGRYNEAVVSFDQAVKADPTNGEAWRYRGLSLALLNRTQEAEESFTKALELNSEDLEASFFQAVSRSHAGNNQSALDSLNHTLSIHPKNREDAMTLNQAYILKGNILKASGWNDEANRSYEQANEIMMTLI